MPSEHEELGAVEWRYCYPLTPMQAPDPSERSLGNVRENIAWIRSTIVGHADTADV